jgi:SAM-dependent methyltransferase
MTPLNQLTPADALRLSFSEIVAITNEPNQPSGGTNTLWTIIHQTRLSEESKVLDVGCNTGFATLGLAALSGAEVTGLDLNEISIGFAKRNLASLSESARASFVVGNALSLPFEDQSFDVLYCNNVTSFIADRESAVGEYYRVLKAGGYLAAVPIYYTTEPSPSLVAKVEELVGTGLTIRTKSQWVELFKSNKGNLIHVHDYDYDLRTAEEIADYAEKVISQPHLEGIDPDLRQALLSRLIYVYSVFNENLQYCGFSILIFRRTSPWGYPTLFTSRPRV